MSSLQHFLLHDCDYFSSIFLHNGGCCVLHSTFRCLCRMYAQVFGWVGMSLCSDSGTTGLDTLDGTGLYSGCGQVLLLTVGSYVNWASMSLVWTVSTSSPMLMSGSSANHSSSSDADVSCSSVSFDGSLLWVFYGSSHVAPIDLLQEGVLSSLWLVECFRFICRR